MSYYTRIICPECGFVLMLCDCETFEQPHVLESIETIATDNTSDAGSIGIDNDETDKN